MKIALTVFVFLLLGAGAAGGIYAWKRLNRIDPRGVQLELQVDINDEQREEVLMGYNQIIDLDSILRPVAEKHNLVQFYKIGGIDKAVEKLRDESYVDFPPTNKRAIHIMAKGKRKDRKVVEAITRDIAEGFLKEIEKRRQAVSGGL